MVSYFNGTSTCIDDCCGRVASKGALERIENDRLQSKRPYGLDEEGLKKKIC